MKQIRAIEKQFKKNLMWSALDFLVQIKIIFYDNDQYISIKNYIIFISISTQFKYEVYFTAIFVLNYYLIKNCIVINFFINNIIIVKMLCFT